MTDNKTVSKSPIDPTVASGVAKLLGPVVIDLAALATDAKQAHWHVRGPNFQPVHELLDVVVDNARTFMDEAAERVVAVGLPLDVRVKTVATTTTTPEMTAGFQITDTAIAEVIAAIDATLATVRIAITELGDIDPVSEDLAIEIARGLEKDRWFLFSHLADK